MASIDDVYEALRRADAAGDEEAARRLSEYIASQQQAAPQRRPGLLEEGLRAGAGAVKDAATGAYQWAKGAVQGPQDLPDLPEFSAPAPKAADTAKAAFGLMMSNNPAAQEDIIRAQYPGVRVSRVKSAETGDEYAIADWTDDSGNRHIGYINAPGLTGRDVASVTGQGLAYLPAARFGQGANLLTGELTRRAPGLAARALRTGAATAATRAGLDKAVEPVGSQQGIDPAEVAVTGAAGAAAEVAAPIVAGTYRALRGSAPNATRRALEEIGPEAAEMPPGAIQEFGRVRQAAPAATAENAGRLQEFDIRASRGQVAQDYPQLNLEDRMRRGLEGPEASAIMKEFDQGQATDIEGAVGRVQGRLQRSPSQDINEARDRFLTGFQTRERALDRQIDDAYEKVRSLGPAKIDARNYSPLDQRLMQALEVEGRVVDQDLTPATNYVLRQVRERLQPAADGTIDLQNFELARRVIGNTLRASKNPTDASNIRLMRRELDNWLDETVDAGLMAGGEDTVKALKQARAARAQYGRLFEQRDGNDGAGAILSKVLNKAETPEMAMNFILGQGELGNRTQAVGAVRRLKEILGDESDAWNALREAAWTKLARDPQGRPRTAETFRKAWQRFTLNNQSLKNELFSPEEVRMMNRYGEALKRTNQSFPRGGTNPSGTAFGVENAIRYALRRSGQRESFVKGNIASGSLLNMLARMPLNPLGASDWAKRRAAAQAVAPLPSQRAVSAPVAAALTPAIAQGQAN